MASKIDPTLAKSLIQEFQKQNQESAEHAWKTPDGQHLNGFFVDRESLETILKNKEVAGIHFHFAKHPDFTGKADKVHTMTMTGSVPNTATAAATPYVSDGNVYDYLSPCPPVCTTIS